MKKMLMMCTVALATAVAFASDPKPEGGPYTEIVEGVEWTFMVDANLNASVGTGSFPGWAIPQSTAGAIAIPAMLGGRSVTRVGAYAFYGCSGLTSVTIPLSVTSIGEAAFRSCVSLTDVTMLEGVKSIGYETFQWCDRLTSVTIPSSVTSIGYLAFQGCYGLGEGVVIVDKCVLTVNGDCPSTVALPGDVRLIADGAFRNCVNLKSVTIPSRVTNIGNYVFSGCSGLTEVTILSSVTSIGSGAFEGCRGLTNVPIPSSVTSIGSSAFEGCTGLVDVTIPQGVTNIAERLFSSCSSLTSVTIPSGVTSIGEDAFVRCTGLTSVIIPEGMTRIGNYAFAFCSSLTSVTIPSSVMNIGDYAFYSCGSLADVTICEGVTGIGSCAFSRCSSLTSVTIPSSVMSIGGSAFRYCGLTDVTILRGVKNIGGYAFSGCSRLTDVTIPQGVTNIAEGVFSSCGTLMEVTIPSSVTSIGESAFQGCSGLTSATISEGVTRIGAYAFRDCSSLTKVTIPSSVTSIEYLAFGGCSGLGEGVIIVNKCVLTVNGECPSTVVLPNDIRLIAGGVFSGCTGLTSVTIPDCVESIGDSAFSGCSGLTSVVIPSRVTIIGNSAFRNCGSLTDVTILEGVKSIGDYAFSGCSALAKVSIPPSVTSIGDYAFEYCSEVAEVAIPSSVTRIGNYAFRYCSGLKNMTMSEGVTSVGNYAFSGCSGLLNVTIPSSVTSIGNYAFYNCGSLTDVTILEGEKSVGGGAFQNCSVLKNVTMSEGVTSVGSYAFNGCSGLSSVTIPSSVTNIGVRAFQNCSSLTNVTIPSGVTSIGSCAFQNCSSLTNVTIPSGVTWIEYSVFGGCSSLTSVTISEGVAVIDYEAFRGCSRLTEVTIPSSVTWIAGDAFRACSGMTNVTILEGVEVIGSGAFLGCSGLTSVTIPSSVTSIGDSAFGSCVSLTDVTILEGVKSIGDYAFSGCSALAKVSIPPSVTSIGDSAFWGCSGLGVGVVIVDKCVLTVNGDCPSIVELPNDVRLIAGGAFRNCVNLTSVTIPDGVESIGDGAFSGCNGLTSVTIPEGVASIGDGVFYGCFRLTSVVMPEGVESIGDSAFNGCSGLSSVTIPSSVASIGDSAFSGCSGLTSVTIPSSVTSTGPGAFYYCGNLVAVYFEGEPPSRLGEAFYTDVPIRYNVEYESVWLPEIERCGFTRATPYVPGVIPLPDGGPYTETVEGIEWTFMVEDGWAVVGSGNYDQTAVPVETSGEISIPTMLGGCFVIGINDCAFNYCQSITGVTIPSRVNRIGRYSFYECIGLTSEIIIPERVTEIGEYAFYNCSALWSAQLPTNLKTVGGYAFYGCQQLYNIWLPEGVSTIGDCAFCGCGIGSVVLSASEVSVGYEAFAGCSGLGSLTITKNVRNAVIGDGAFVASGVSSVDILSASADVGAYAFVCQNLSRVTIEGVTRIRAGAFGGGWGYGGSADLIVASGEVTFDDQDFYGYGNGSISTITISKDVKSAIIGKGVFAECTGLSRVEILSASASIGDSAFSKCGNMTEITLGNGVTNIGANAFQECTSLSEVTIPSSVTNIGECAFYGCSGLASVIVSRGVKTFGGDAFSNCEAIEAVYVYDLAAWCSSVFCGYGANPLLRDGYGARLFVNDVEVSDLVIPECVTSIGRYCFDYCKGLTNVTMSSSVTNVGEYAFWGCEDLKRVTISDIAAWCNISFDGCEANPLYYARRLFVGGEEVTNLVIPDDVSQINDYAFVNCGNIDSVLVPTSVTSVGAAAFEGSRGVRNATVPGWTCNIDFSNVTNLVISDGTTSIGASAFAGSTQIARVSIPVSVTNVGSKAFLDCSALRRVDISDVAAWCGIAFGNETANPLYYAKLLYVNGTMATTLVIPSGVPRVGDYAFYNFSPLKHVTIPSSVASVGRNAFNGCINLNSIDFEGAPPTGVGSASIKQNAAIRYNVVYQAQWLPVIQQCGWTNAKPYDPFAPLVSSVVAKQRYPWNGKVDVLFDVSSVREESRVLVVRAVDRNSGITNVAEHVTGDVECTAGSHHVIWDMSEDGLTLVSSNVVFGASYEVPATAYATNGGRGASNGGGWSDETPIDLTPGMRLAKKTETLTYSTDWADGVGSDAIAEIAVNGTVISSESGSGTAIWTPKRDGQYELTHTIKTNGVAVGEALTAEFIAKGINPKTPVIVPASGTTFDLSLTVSMTCESTGATIHYTTDGTTPTMASPVYKRFRIWERTVVKAIAFYADGLESDMAVAEYAPGRCDDPVITPPDGTEFEHSGQSVSIRRTAEDGVLRYTIDGSDPTAESPEYKGPFTIDDTTVVKAKAFGDQYFDSNIVTATLTRIKVKLPTPEITAESPFTGTKNKVVMSCANEGATIYYTLDGSRPTTSSSVYSKPFCVTGGCVIKAMAVQYDYRDSDVAVKTITKAWCIGDTMGKSDHAFETSGEVGFVRVVDATAALGESMRSGVIKNSQTSILSTVVVGPGKLSFKWKTSCEYDYPLHAWDHAEFVLDGDVLEVLDGKTDWQSVTCDITGDVAHSVIWRYVKDDMESAEDDCMWVSEYVWESEYTETKTTGVPVPYLWLEEKCSDVVDEFESYEKVAKQKALNKRLTVEQCYVAGVDPESLTQDFTTTITMEGGFPTVTWNPDLGVLREYKVWGKASLIGGEWQYPTNSAHRFFKVTVEMP